MNTVLFDLDGTLLPMDMQEFIETYVFLLKNRLISSGYDSDKIIESIWAGVNAVTKNSGMITNEECFWRAFEDKYTGGVGKLESRFKRKLEKEMTKFYKEDFGVARYIAHPLETVSECSDILKETGYQIAVATQPVFPEVATRERIMWAGLNADDFALITTYENSCYAKPNLKYYEYILKTLDKDPEDCLMVGNDVGEDMCAKELGMDVFLLNTYEINTKNEDTYELKKGNWKVFKEYISNLPSLN